MENLEVVELFAGARKFDRLAGDRLDGERRAAAGVAVELCQDHAGDVEQVVERLCDVHGLLTGHCIDDEQDVRRMDSLADVFQLVHQRLVNLQTAGRIDDDVVVAVVACVAHGGLGDFHRVFGAHLKHRDARLPADDLKLLDRGRAVDVARNEQRPAAAALEHLRELRRVRRLAGALQTAHHDDGRRVRGHFQPLLAAAHQRGQLLVDDLDDHLRGRQALHHILADGALRDALCEVLRNLVVDVGLEQGEAHLAHGLLDVGLGELALVFQFFKRIAELVGKTFKRHVKSFPAETALSLPVPWRKRGSPPRFGG